MHFKEECACSELYFDHHLPAAILDSPDPYLQIVNTVSSSLNSPGAEPNDIQKFKAAD